MKKYKFYSDSGHGWLAVKTSELIALGILGKITAYSYQSKSGKTVYLEEDCDATTFCHAKGWTGPMINENATCKYSEASPIRSYDSFNLASHQR